MKNLIYLIGGNTVAQLITILLSPVLSRIYSPKEFGLFGSITSIVYFINSFSLMRLEVELLKNKHNKEEIYQYALSILFIITTALFLLILILNLSSIYYILPILVMLSGYYNLSYYNLLLENNVKNINKNKIILAISIGFSQLGLGFIGFTGIGLILGHLIGFFITLLLMKNEFYGLKIQGIMSKYKRNIFFDSPSMALNVVSNHGPTVVIFSLLGGAIGGAYFMAFRILILPISVISSSISNYISSNFLVWNNRKVKQKKILDSIILCTFPLLLISYFIIDDIVLFVLGGEWVQTALIAKISVFWLYIRFLFDAFYINFSLLNKQKNNLFFQVFNLFARFTSIILPYYLGWGVIEIIKLFCMVSFITYVIGFFLLLKVAEIKSKLFNSVLFFIFIFYITMEGYI